MKRSHTSPLSKPFILKLKKPWGLEILRDCPRHRAVLSGIQHSCLLVEGMLLHPLSDYSLTLLMLGSRAGNAHHLQCHFRAWRTAMCMSRCNTIGLFQERRKMQALSASLLHMWILDSLDFEMAPHCGKLVFLNSVLSLMFSTDFSQALVFISSLASF